jgi:uncharacterized protein YraI
MHTRPSTTLATGLAILLACAGVPSTSRAQTPAYTNQPVNLMAGPGYTYPIVSGLQASYPVQVMGCISTYEWCDVALPGLRGWIFAGALSYPYDGSVVPVIQYGAVIGFPVVIFAIDSYWDRFYRGRPWYGDRDRWRVTPQPVPHGSGPRTYAPGTSQPRGYPLQQTQPRPPYSGERRTAPQEHGGHADAPAHHADAPAHHPDAN